MQVNNPLYRKLGGWLMFINVITILNVVTYGYGLLSGIVSLVQLYGPNGYYPNSFYSQYYYAFFGILSLATILLALPAGICTLIFLHKRKKRPFMAAFFAERGVGLLSSVCTVFFFWRYSFADIFEGFFYGLYEYNDLFTRQDLANIGSMFRVIMLSIFAVGFVINIGLAIAWAFYFRRSKRVKVYFDPNYVEPPWPMWNGMPTWYATPPPPPGYTQPPTWNTAYSQPPQPYANQYPQPLPPQAPVQPPPQAPAPAAPQAPPAHTPPEKPN